MTIRYTVRGQFNRYHDPDGSLMDNARLDVADMLRFDNARIERFRLIIGRPPTAEIDIVGARCTPERWNSFGYRVLKVG